MARRIIVTGGPGSGKTTLIECLEAMGNGSSQEVSRRLIREQSAREDGVLPWHNLPAFAELALVEMLRAHEDARSHAGLVFFDRGLPDIMGYLRNSGLEVPAAFYEAHSRCRYAQTVFVLPPWPEIYVNDAERPQSFSEAQGLYRAIRQAYGELGYTLVDVPKLGGSERARFVLSHLTQVVAHPGRH